MQWRGRLLGHCGESTSLQHGPCGFEGISRDRGSQEPLAGSPRKDNFSGTILSCLDHSARIRHRTGGMALQDRLIRYSVKPAQCVSEDLPCRRCRTECSTWSQVVPQELLCMP